VPPPPVRELPELNRARTIITGNVPGKSSGWRQALIKGQDAPAALAEMAQRRMRSVQVLPARLRPLGVVSRRSRWKDARGW
jgi:hypothetical protein